MDFPKINQIPINGGSTSYPAQEEASSHEEGKNVEVVRRLIRESSSTFHPYSQQGYTGNSFLSAHGAAWSHQESSSSQMDVALVIYNTTEKNALITIGQGERALQTSIPPGEKGTVRLQVPEDHEEFYFFVQLDLEGAKRTVLTKMPSYHCPEYKAIIREISLPVKDLEGFPRFKRSPDFQIMDKE